MGALRAACDMAAERGGAAALDRRHHLELAHVTGVGTAPSRPLGAENIRDLQHETRHGNAPVLR